MGELFWNEARSKSCFIPYVEDRIIDGIAAALHSRIEEKVLGFWDIRVRTHNPDVQDVFKLLYIYPFPEHQNCVYSRILMLSSDSCGLAPSLVYTF
jgi:hypothetical protein